MPHTPGPWTVGDDGFSFCGPSPDEWGIGSVYAYETRAINQGQGISDEEQKANAKLIAASPDLLAACRMRIEDHQCEQKSDGPHADCPCWYCRTCAAIAKATGA